jgi:hypothetical protein
VCEATLDYKYILQFQPYLPWCNQPFEERATRN